MLTQDRDEELVLFMEIRRHEKGREKGHQGSLLMGPCSCIYISIIVYSCVNMLSDFNLLFVVQDLITLVVRRQCRLNHTLAGELPPITSCTPRTRSPITIGT